MTEEGKQQEAGDNDEEMQADPQSEPETDATTSAKPDTKTEEDENDEENPPNTTTTTTTTTTNSSSDNRLFPKAFYDPITNRVMKDPVVLPNGYSYERTVAMEKVDSTVTYYPNRALRSYIEQEVDRVEAAGSMRGTLMKWNESMRSGWQKLLEKSALPSGEYRPLPDAFYCPITFDLIHEAAIDPDGYSYEKEAIIQWIQANGDSPVTRKQLSVEQLYDKNALLDALWEETEKEESQNIHPSIRRWKHEISTRQATPTPTPTTPSAPTSDQPAPTSPTPHRTYPTNRQQWEAEYRRRRHVVACTALGLLLLMVIISIFVPSVVAFIFFYIFLSIFVGSIRCRPQQ